MNHQSSFLRGYAPVCFMMSALTAVLLQGCTTTTTTDTTGDVPSSAAGMRSSSDQGMMTASSQNMMTASSASTAAANTTVVISGFAFGPSILTVPQGTVVTWTNKDTASHTVTEDNGAAGPKSTTLKTGQTYSFKFDTPGTYAYHCTIHPSMNGKVIVTK